MRIMLEEELDRATTLDEAELTTRRVLDELTGDGLQIHYVAGVVSADGDHMIASNVEKLLAERTRLMHQLGDGAIVLAAPFVFTPENLNRWGMFNLERDQREELLRGFWDNIIQEGLIYAIHFAPGWQRSPGARREHEVALARHMPVFYAGSNDRD